MAKKPTIFISYNAPVILTFALLAAGALGLNLLTAGQTNGQFFSVYRSSFTDPLTYLRFFTHVLGHSDFEHFYGNICFLLIVGPMTEEKYGSRNLLIAIAVTALVSGIIHFALFPGTALLGASGIVFMLILLSSMANSSDGRIPLTLILVAAIYLGKEVLAGLFSGDNISQLTHVIGGICGIFAGMLLNGRRK